MRASTSPRPGLLAAALLAAAMGCGKPPSSLAEVSGMVMMDGKPLAGVIVTFYPIVEKGEPRKAFSRATTDAAGKFTLTAEDGKPGAVVGKHKVVVNWPLRSARDMAAQPPPGPPIPMSYTVASDTPLEKEVQAGPNSIDIEVKK